MNTYRVHATSPDHDPTTLNVDAATPMVAILCAETRLIRGQGWTREECERGTFHAYLIRERDGV